MTSIAAETRMRSVTLDVADLELVTSFYAEGVGLNIVGEKPGGMRSLGRDNNVLINLRHSPALKHAGPSDAGLFHTALLFDNKAFLAASVVNVAQLFPGSFTGSSDHLVSEAFYFNDPEGNGVELYWDRPRDTWRVSDGEIQMDTLYLDPNQFIQQHATDTSMTMHGTGNVQIGHVHLSVGNIPAAQEFYVRHLGFDQTFEWNESAVFVSAGGYHHHVAMNIWRSRGAGLRQPTLGLGMLEIELPTADDLGATVERLGDYGHRLRDNGSAVEVNDPWGNVVRISLASKSGPPE